MQSKENLIKLFNMRKSTHHDIKIAIMKQHKNNYLILIIIGRLVFRLKAKRLMDDDEIDDE